MKTNATLQFIGIVKRATENEQRIEVLPQFCDGLRGIEVFSHIIVLYWAHLRDDQKKRRTLLVFPRRHALNVETGVFACRSPSRPNPICLCVVELVRVEGCALTVKGLDALENSPIVDIKPYLPRADLVLDAEAPRWALHGPTT